MGEYHMAEKRQHHKPARSQSTPWMASFICLLAWSLVVGCADVPPTYPYEKEPNPFSAEYVIGAGDDLSISVFQHNEFNTRGTVRPDGTITLPLVGDLKADGQTPTQLKETILSRLGTFLKEGTAPQVTVAVTAANSYFVTVAGNVVRPGRFQSTSFLTVAEAIALAGGPNRFAAADEAFVIRRAKDGKHRKIPINYEQIKRGEYLQQNILLLTGDQLMVP